MARSCAGCGESVEARHPSAKYCSDTCRQRGSRKGRQAAAQQLTADDPLVAAVRAELEAADRLDSALGQQAVALAQHMASPFDTGSARAAVSRELRAVMDAALADAPRAADALDELAGRRQQKASSA